MRVCGVRVLVGILPPGGIGVRAGADAGCGEGLQLHAHPYHVAAFDAVFEDRGGIVFAEVVLVDAAAYEPAAQIEGDLPRTRISRTDFETAEARLPGRSDGMGEKGRADALPLEPGNDGDIHHLGREGAGVEQYVLPGERIAAAGGIAGPAADVVGHGGFRFVGQQEQFVRRGVCPFDRQLHGVRD